MGERHAHVPSLVVGGYALSIVLLQSALGIFQNRKSSLASVLPLPCGQVRWTFGLLMCHDLPGPTAYLPRRLPRMASTSPLGKLTPNLASRDLGSYSLRPIRQHQLYFDFSQASWSTRPLWDLPLQS